MLRPVATRMRAAWRAATRAAGRALAAAFGRFFAALYGPLAALYDPVAWLVSRGAWPAWGRAALPALDGRVLELGPGTGHLLLALAERETPVVGLDRSAALLARARRRLTAAGRDVPLVCADARALPLADGRFERVVTAFPAPFVAVPAVASEVRRVLCRDGCWVIVDAARPGGTDLWSRLARLALRLSAGSAPAADTGDGASSQRPRPGWMPDGFTGDARQVAVGRDSVLLQQLRPTDGPPRANDGDVGGPRDR